MDACEVRIRAVKLHIKLGRRLGATIRQLGQNMVLVAWNGCDSGVKLPGWRGLNDCMHARLRFPADVWNVDCMR